jgi:DNA-binding GntR family transcriptional regulator
MPSETIQQEGTNRDTPLERIFFIPAAARVLDFFMLNQNLLSSESEISKLTEISPRTLQRVLPLLLKEKLIKRERKDGIAFKYEIDLESERSRALLAYFKATIRDNLQNPEFYQQNSNPKNKRVAERLD